MTKTNLLKPTLLTAALLVLFGLLITISVMADSDQTTASEQTLLGQFVISGGPIVWFVLLPMSVVTVSLSVKYSLLLRRSRLMPARAEEEIEHMLGRLDNAELSSRLGQRRDLLSRAVAAGLIRGTDYPRKIESAMAESLQQNAQRLLRKIEWINLIGDVSPMVGLFGTVFGMIKLFNSIVVAGGQPRPVHLAGGISVALVTTFWGLLIAIPALTIHGIFNNRIESLVAEAADKAENLLGCLNRRIKKPNRTRKPGSSQSISRLSSGSAQAASKSISIQELG